jgi:hypothetical protein
MGDILVKEGHLFSIVFISKFLGFGRVFDKGKQL